jgi:dimethylhistidine N-methyltransferase
MSLGNTSAVLPAAQQSALGAEVLRGLAAQPKSLSPWLFYDQRGSQLFDQITQLPEYYLTRTERELFSTHAPAILAAAGKAATLTLIELGAGSASKTGILLRAALAQQPQLTYRALDVSASALEAARQSLSREFPTLTIETRVRDYTHGIGHLPSLEQPNSRRLVLYIGSSIGNFDPADARELLRDIRQQLAPGDCILLGVDHVKSLAPLLAAYNDAAGVTPAFNLNVLTRINRELGADFRLDRFQHRAIFNTAESRIEMHLVSTCAQHVSIPALDLDIDFAKDETIHTENSYKFTPESATALLASGSFQVTHSWTDPRNWFGVYLASAK